MATAIRDLMSSPPVTCGPASSLADAASAMQEHGIGSVVVIEGTKVAGILTERDVLRAVAADADSATEPVHLWMTANPDVLAPGEDAGDAWASLTHHHYRHLPVVAAGALVGVVSIRDLLAMARIRPAVEARTDVPKGLEGVVAAETSVGSVRGLEGFYHYRQYSAVELAEKRTLEDVWQLLFDGELPGHESAEAFTAETAALRELPAGVASILPDLASSGTPLAVLRTTVSMLGPELGWAPTLDIDAAELRRQCLHLCSLVPTILAAAYRLRNGLRAVPPRSDLSRAANYLWMLLGEEAPPEHVRAVEQYLILTIDHGFNASTFAARVIASTGAGLDAAVTGALGAFSGPLHGGAPSRALDMLDEIAEPERAEAWLRASIEQGDRLMGFGHRVYKTDDPRSVFLRGVARSLGGPLFDFAEQVEQTALAVLAELKPRRRLYTNVEFYAGVVMHTCGIPREMFTPTFASSRTIGWATHVMEQAGDNRLIRPASRYVGPPAPRPVTAR